jgi:hypothetical protein
MRRQQTVQPEPITSCLKTAHNTNRGVQRLGISWDSSGESRLKCACSDEERGGATNERRSVARGSPCAGLVLASEWGIANAVHTNR